MIFALLFFAELFLLFLLSGSLTRNLSLVFYRITKREKVTVTLIALLFFPGTLIHELAHAIMARLLFVRVGHIEFVPVLHNDTVKLGSVAIEKTDLLRRLLIGMAPFLLGTGIILGSMVAAVHYDLAAHPLWLLVLGYIVFEVGNTMFSSKKDMEGALELLFILLLLFGIFYYLGFRIPSLQPEMFFAQPLVQDALRQGTLFLLAPLGIDLLILLFLRFFLR